ncbi:MAG: hypothetical protein JW727_03100 [Candidatus Aenigmarchaeota archaeon]|nr:hypothetical protein [Candidatus Aenigmarchaeota archaeon]
MKQQAYNNATSGDSKIGYVKDAGVTAISYASSLANRVGGATKSGASRATGYAKSKPKTTAALVGAAGLAATYTAIALGHLDASAADEAIRNLDNATIHKIPEAIGGGEGGVLDNSAHRVYDALARLDDALKGYITAVTANVSKEQALVDYWVDQGYSREEAMDHIERLKGVSNTQDAVQSVYDKHVEAGNINGTVQDRVSDGIRDLLGRSQDKMSSTVDAVKDKVSYGDSDVQTTAVQEKFFSNTSPHPSVDVSDMTPEKVLVFNEGSFTNAPFGTSPSPASVEQAISQTDASPGIKQQLSDALAGFPGGQTGAAVAGAGLVGGGAYAKKKGVI